MEVSEMNLADGEYTVEVTMEGGSGRASVFPAAPESKAKKESIKIVKDDKIIAIKGRIKYGGYV